MKLIYFFCSLFAVFFTANMRAQLGSTHYLPPVHDRDVPGFGQGITSAYVYLSTPTGDNTEPITVRIKTGDGNLVGTREIYEGQPASINVINQIKVSAGELNRPLSNKGLILESDKVFYASLRIRAASGNHAGYLTTKGEDALGINFRVGMSPLRADADNHNFFTSIMASEDNTEITINDFDVNIVFEPNIVDDELNVILNKGESYTLSGYSNAANPANSSGFIGARITSSKPIAVSTGNLNGNLPKIIDRSAGTDYMLDQIVDESLTGFEFMLIKGNGVDDLEQPMIIATKDNTEVYLNGETTPSIILANAGDFAFINESSDNYQPNSGDHRNLYITTKDPLKPLYVYQFLGGTRSNTTPRATPGMNFIPPLSCFFQNNVNLIPTLNEISPSDTDFTSNILITAAKGVEVRYNGTLLTGALDNPGTTEWETYLIKDQNSGNALIEGNGPLAAALAGSDGRSSGFGGYYSGFAVEPEDTDTDVCTEGGPINLFDRIDGNPTPGGTWSPALSDGDNFDPKLDSAGTYNYQVMGFCSVINVNVEVTLIDSPQIDPITDIVACESYTLVDPISLPGSNLQAPEYRTDSQANGGGSLIDWTTPVTTLGEQTIYVFDSRTADPDACEDEISFKLTIVERPIANPVQEQFVCDDPSEDGMAIFNLTDLSDTVLGPSQLVADFNVTYYKDQADADLGSTPLTPENAFETNSTTVYARIESVLNVDCFATTPISLGVGELPQLLSVLTTPRLIQCDDDSDGRSIFNLSEVEELLTADYENQDFEYTAPDGSLITNVTAYNNDVPNETIGVKITTTDGCEKNTTIRVSAITAVIPTTFSPTFESCDTDRDGLARFDMSSVTTDLLVQEYAANPDLEVNYYETRNDALSEVNSITEQIANYQNNPTYTDAKGIQKIWVRVDDGDDNSCQGIGEVITLTVGIYPELSQTTAFEITNCYAFETYSGTDDIDLDQLTSDINLLAPTQDKDDVRVTYHISPADANDNRDALPSPFPAVDGDELFVRVQGNLESCFITSSVTLQLKSNPEAQTPSAIITCEDDPGINGIPVSGVATYNLENQTDEITNSAIGVTTAYYKNLQDATDEVDEITNPDSFVNTDNLSTIYAVVTDDITACKSEIISFNLVAEPLPYVDFSAEGGIVCVDAQTGDIISPMMLDATPANLQADRIYTYEWRLNGDTLADTSSNIEITEIGTYVVTIISSFIDPVTSVQTDCAYTASTAYTAESAPFFTATVVEGPFTKDGQYTVEIDPTSITGFGLGDYEFAIDGGSYTPDLTFENVRAGEHIISGRGTLNGCNPFTVIVNVLDYPRFFTPNGDGFHDRWNVVDTGGDFGSDTRLFIFDRYGKLLKQLNINGPGWDGTIKGQPVPSSEYWFRLEYTTTDDEGNPKADEFSGHFTLKR